MNPVRLGAVSFLNARPLVYGLERSPRFDVRFDAPSRCADLLHAGSIDLGLSPSIEYLRGGPYRAVPDLAIGSRGPVASVMLYTRKPMNDVRSIAMDTSSRTSVALVRILCARHYRIDPAIEPQGPDLEEMLASHDAALIIGDRALFLDPAATESIDLGAVWTSLTGLPFIYAFWAGRPGALDPVDVEALRRARDEGVRHSEELARDAFPGEPHRQALCARYLRDNIKYVFGADERAGLEAFYRYAAEAGLVEAAAPVRFYE